MLTLLHRLFNALFQPGSKWRPMTDKTPPKEIVPPVRSPFHAEALRYCEHMGLTDPADLHAAIRELEENAKATGRKD